MMRVFTLICFSLVLMFSTGNVHAQSADEVAKALTTRFEDAGVGDNARLGVLVVDAQTGQRILDINSDVPMKPASLTKMFTTAVALDQLGPAHRFYTTVETDGEIDEDGVLRGDLIVRGGGDPGLGPRFQVEKGVTKVFEDWAEDLKRLGIRRIEGNIIGDDSFFRDDRWGPEWYFNERAEWYMAEVAALSFNDNCIDVTFDGGGSVGEQADVEKLIPDFDYYDFESRLQIVDDGSTSVDLFRSEEANKVTATGKIVKDTKKTRWAAVQDPARFTAHTFLNVLNDKGIRVSGEAVSRHRAEGAAGPNPPARHLLIRHFSAPISDQSVVILTNSQNLYTEMAARAAAIKSGYDSTFEGATTNITNWLQERNLVQPGFVIFDASGLSPLNRIPPRMMADILLHMRKQGFNGKLFEHCLARPGKGSLTGRFLDLKSDLRAKTGTLGDTNCLAGYLTLPSGKEYIVVSMNDHARNAQKVNDAIVRDIEAALRGE